MNTFDWLSRLIRFDTTSRNSNVEIIDFIQEWFVEHKAVIRLTRDPHQPKANLFATLPAQDGSLDGGVIFSGHTDVVPVDGQQWDTNPFEAVQVEDKIYGRGACDMKGFLAVVLSLVPAFHKLKLSKPVHFAFSYDEEVGCTGAPLMIDDLLHTGIKPSACIVGEPTEMHPVIAHKGIQVFRCTVRGCAAHSSLTIKGCNAIEYAAKLIGYIRHLADELRQTGPFDHHFDVPFTSVSTNMIQGGIANNVVPEQCEFIFEFRHLPSMKPHNIIDKITHYVQQELLPQMQKEQVNAGIEVKNIAVVPSFESSEDGVIDQLIRIMNGDKAIHKVAYATEAGLFQRAQIPTIVCGPGSIEQAHRPNEFVSILQLKKCEALLRKVIHVL
ncbi:MAG: acetylornithine deacetylase [Gammaproteobacteria bacterium]|nr:acetylornithine deacetylase [Gammaproteobacteria bacterium]MCW5583411.1 acetylornithine deacetylase [Gammaproteobacteria bacterium]